MLVTIGILKKISVRFFLILLVKALYFALHLPSGFRVMCMLNCHSRIYRPIPNLQFPLTRTRVIRKYIQSDGKLKANKEHVNILTSFSDYARVSREFKRCYARFKMIALHNKVDRTFT